MDQPSTKRIILPFFHLNSKTQQRLQHPVNNRSSFETMPWSTSCTEMEEIIHHNYHPLQLARAEKNGKKQIYGRTATYAHWGLDARYDGRLG